MAVSARVCTASGQEMRIAEGSQLIFGRGPEVDLAVAAGRGLSRRAGIVTAMPAGAWITNISRTHALYVEGEGYRIRLPRLEDGEDPAGGWLLHSGTALVGSRAMLDEGLPLQVTVTGQRGLAGDAELPGRGWLACPVSRDGPVLLLVRGIFCLVFPDLDRAGIDRDADAGIAGDVGHSGGVSRVDVPGDRRRNRVIPGRQLQPEFGVHESTGRFGGLRVECARQFQVAEGMGVRELAGVAAPFWWRDRRGYRPDIPGERQASSQDLVRRRLPKGAFRVQVDLVYPAGAQWLRGHELASFALTDRPWMKQNAPQCRYWE